MPDTHVLNSVRSRVSPLEWKARLDCAALYRLMAHFGQTDLIFNHITLRVPGEANRILINPYGWMYEEITASSLVTIDLDGNEVLNPHGPDASVNFAGYVIHTHTRAGMAVASMKCGFLPMTQTAISCFPVAYHDYEGPAVDVAERERLVDHLGSANFLVLRNHGLLVCNKTAAGAFRSIHQFEAACQAQVDAMPRGGDSADLPLLVPEKIVAASVERRRIAMAKRPSVELHWPAMLRLLDRRDPGWRD